MSALDSRFIKADPQVPCTHLKGVPSSQVQGLRGGKVVPMSPEPSKCGECSRTSKISDEDNIPGACDLKEELQIPARVFRRLTVMTSGSGPVATPVSTTASSSPPDPLPPGRVPPAPPPGWPPGCWLLPTRLPACGGLGVRTPLLLFGTLCPFHS